MKSTGWTATSAISSPIARPATEPSGTVDPLQLLNGIIAKSQGLYERNNITISLTDERRGGDLVQGDPALLEQAMTSLMTNSVEAMPNGGHLTLKVATPQAAIVGWNSPIPAQAFRRS